MMQTGTRPCKLSSVHISHTRGQAGQAGGGLLGKREIKAGCQTCPTLPLHGLKQLWFEACFSFSALQPAPPGLGKVGLE